MPPSSPPSPATAAARTASAPSPTVSSAMSSPAFPSRTAPAPARSPTAGAASGAPPRSSSSTPTSSRTAAPSTGSPQPARCPASSPPTRAPSAASSSPTTKSTIPTRTRSRTGSASSPTRAWRISPSSTAPSPSTCHCSCRCPSSTAALRSAASTSGSGSSRSPPASRATPTCRSSPTSRSSASATASWRSATCSTCSLAAPSWRFLLLWHSLAVEVAVMAASRLQRLIIYCTFPTVAGTTIKVKIGYAPELFVLGYLDTAKHVLEIGNTIIKAGVTEVSPNTVVPTVKVLALKARFRVAEEVRTLLSFLRCSPEVETLYIMASDNDIEHYDDPGEVKPRDKLNSTFWQGFVPIKCVQSRVKKVVFDQFSGGTNQFGFLKMVLRKAVLLQKVIVLLAGLDSVKASEATRKLRPVVSKRKWASKVMDEISLEVRGRAADHVWRYDEASDLSTSDPFIS